MVLMIDALVKIAYHGMPALYKKRVRAHLFEPRRDAGILDRIVRRYLNLQYCALAESERNDFSQDFWRGAAGSSWIETKRSRYSRGQMEKFLQKVRAPFVSMVIAFLEENKDYRYLVDIGTGPGQLCFDLFETLGPGYSLIGIDLNAAAIERNSQRVKDSGFSANVRFECADAIGWFRKQHGIDNILALSIATLKFFPRYRVQELLQAIRHCCKNGAIILCEEVADDFFKDEHSSYTRNLGFSHNYLLLLKEAGYQIKKKNIIEVEGHSSGIQQMCLTASF